MKQQTLAKNAYFSGIGLHTGDKTNLIIKSASENTGIIFRRTDLDGTPEIIANAKNVTDVTRATTISDNGAHVVTVEHILATFHALNIDNAIVEMDKAEPPLADGSSEPFIKIVLEAGIVEQNADAEYWECKDTIIVEEGDSKLIITPADKFKISCIVSYGETAMDTQYYSNTITPEIFQNEIMAARTFCSYREIEAMIAMDIVKGGSLDNAVILHEGAIISKEGLRYKDEMVRHKVLDIIGDIFLVGKRIKGHIIAIKPGHPINVKLAQKILSQ